MENNWHSVNKRSGPETVGLWNKALDTGCPPAGKWGLYRTCCSFWCTLQKAQCAMKSEHTISAQEMSPYTCVRLYRGLKLGFKKSLSGNPYKPRQATADVLKLQVTLATCQSSDLSETYLQSPQSMWLKSYRFSGCPSSVFWVCILH